MAIVQAAFSQLLKPGLRAAFAAAYSGKVWFADDLDIVDWIEEQERMAVLHPNTSKIPRWRQPARRNEAPIIAYRCWELGKDEKQDWLLLSVAAQTQWEGPVIQSDDPPLDPAVWDKAKREHGDRSLHAREKTAHVFCKAGIHAVKTLAQGIKTAQAYDSEVYGEVSLWGRVAQFERGYRAEYCMIKKLYLDRERTLELHAVHKKGEQYLKVIADSLSRRYQCDVEVV